MIDRAGIVDVYFWLYVSKSTIEEKKTDEIIRQIVDFSRSKNDRMNITGALVYSDFHFAQIIEGPAASIMALRSSIRSDPRHHGIQTIAQGRTRDRRFGRWALAFSGNSITFSREIQRAARDSIQRSDDAGERLLSLMRETLAW